MGATIYSDSKLQYYPTDTVTTTQVALTLSDYVNVKEEYKKDIDEIRKKVEYDLKKALSIVSKNKLLNKGLEYELSGKVVADLFCGKGEWLSLFKNNVVKKSSFYKSNVLIGNELDKNRYKEMKETYDIDYTFNKPFEDLQLPKYIVDIMLFNPPYGEYNGVRNAKKYLQMIFDRELMSVNGAIVLVLNETDIRDCQSLVVRYLEKLTMFKVNQEEFEKFGQYVLIGLVKERPYDLNNLQDVVNYKQEFTKISGLIDYIVNEKIEFDVDNLYYYNYKISSSGNMVHKEFKSYEETKVSGDKISHKDKAYKWLMNMTLVESLAEKTIDVPKPLKTGEIANIISSGKINGEISLDNGEAKHIVVGGVKTVTSNEIIETRNKKGELENKLVTTKTSVPYLNILINNNGKAENKELKSESEE